ncbi:MAG: pyridoxal-phosphate dependent enzyme [Chitinophagaceae bacterium]|nr:pyridoxal-phosphate dependent enzyme [Chitinophagaceae bacterium]
MATIEPPDASRIRVDSLPGFGDDNSIDVNMLRLDRMHPFISGNKWFKLCYNIEDAIRSGKQSILSFGGAYSNHLIALAAAAYARGLSSIGLVRGEEAVHNSVLAQCQAYGMQLHYLSRAHYAAKEDAGFLAELEQHFPEALIVPEGGANEAGERGAAEIAGYIDRPFSHVALSVGTGTSFIGLRRALPDVQQLLGFAPMKGGAYLAGTIKAKLQGLPENNWQVYDRFHFGGFGKISAEVSTFMARFYEQYGVELDRVYTAKMMLGIRQLINEGAFPEGAQILCIHTGGLTGNDVT